MAESNYKASLPSVGQPFRSVNIDGVETPVHAISHGNENSQSLVGAGNPLPVVQSSANTATRSTFTSSVDTAILAANVNRKEIHIYNEGPDGILLVGLGDSEVSSASYSYPLEPGKGLEIKEFTGELRGIFSIAGQVAHVTEVLWS